MRKYYFLSITILLSVVIFYSCSDQDDDYVPVSPVTVDLTLVPYPKLSDYKFFEGDIKEQIPSLNVIPYEPASSLFTDYASKKRFIWMPAGVAATYVADEYVWNDEQTDADLISGVDFTTGGAKTITFAKPSGEIITTDYRIPSDAECFACHKINEIGTPIGVKPQNLNHSHTYGNSNKNILQKLVEQGYLQSYPSNIVSTVDYHDATKPVALRLRSYLDANCAHCHQDEARCYYRPIRLPFSQSDVDSNIGICLFADEQISPSLQKIIAPGNYSKSIMHYRLSSNDESERMPLLGRTIVHDEGVALLEEYISSLTQTCN